MNIPSPIRRAESKDLPSLLLLDERSGLGPWGRAFWAERLIDPLCIVLVWDQQEPAGYSLLRIVAGEAELLRIAVLPEQREHGIGFALLQASLESAAQMGCQQCFLEVRPSNLPALRLYQSAGFCEIGQRRNYYLDPREDALLLAVELRPAGIARVTSESESR